MSAIVTCDNCGASRDTGGRHECQPEDRCDKLESDLDGIAGDIMRLDSELKKALKRIAALEAERKC